MYAPTEGLFVSCKSLLEFVRQQELPRPELLDFTASQESKYFVRNLSVFETYLLNNSRPLQIEPANKRQNKKLLKRINLNTRWSDSETASASADSSEDVIEPIPSSSGTTQINDSTNRKGKKGPKSNSYSEPDTPYTGSGDFLETAPKSWKDVFTPRELFLAGHQSLVANLHVKNKIPNQVAEVELHPRYKDSHLVILNGICAPRKNVIRIIMYNKSEDTLRVPSHSVIARVRTVTGLLIEPEKSTREGDVGGQPTVGLTTPFGCAAFTAPRTVVSTDEVQHRYDPNEVEEFLNHFHVGDQLTFEQRQRLGELLLRYRKRFVIDGANDSLGLIPDEAHRIDTGDAAPVNHNPYRVSAFERRAIEEQVNKMLADGIIKPISSSWTSPVVIVSKRDASLRFCVDYRDLNTATKPDRYPLPRIDDALDQLGGADMYSTMDACSAYWQIPMHPDSVEKTTFTCHLGTFAFNFMPFGLRNAPATMSRAMAKIFSQENRQICIVYLDDIIAFAQGFDQHMERLETLFSRMDEHNLKLKPSKCFFADTQVSFLGHRITADGISPDPERTKTLLNYRPPKDKTEIKSFLGFTGFYRRFIKNYAMTARPLNVLLRKGQPFIWGSEQKRAFELLKEHVLNPPVLTHYDPNAFHILRTDSSGFGLGGHLMQAPSLERRSEAKLLACVSRSLSAAESAISEVCD